MSLTAGFNPKPSGTLLVIKDWTGAEVYRHETPNVKSQQPIASLSLNEWTQDAIGTNHGTVTGTETYVNGKYGKAFAFNNATRINLDNPATFQFGKNVPFSFSFWYKPKTGEFQNRAILGNAESISSDGWLIFYNNGSGQGTNDRLIWYLIDPTSVTYSVSCNLGDINLNEWNFVSCSYGGGNDRANMFMWINGVKHTTSSLTTMVQDFTQGTPANLTIGAGPLGGIPLGASDVQNVNIYDYELTDAQHTDLYNSESPYGFVSKTGAVTQDFNLTDLNCHIGSNDDYGTLEFMIEDSGNVLIDNTDERRGVVIKPEYTVELYSGKDAGGLDRWFKGVIKDVDVIRPTTNVTRIKCMCTGYGILLKERITIMKVNQDKLADGESLDETDTKTKLYNLILKLFTDTDHHVDDGIPLMTEIHAKLGATGLCDQCLDVTVANVNEQFTSYASFISRMAGIAQTDWYVNPEGRLIIRDGISHDTGLLVSNDLTGLDVTGWNPKRLSYPLNQSFGWRDSSIEGQWRWIHGAGHFAPVLDSKNETTPNAADDLIGEWLAFPVTIRGDNIFKLALRLTKSEGASGINSHAELRIVGGDGSGKYSEGSVNLSTMGAADSLNTLTVNGVEIMGSSTTFSGSARATALTVAGKINENETTPEYFAYVDNASKVIIRASYQSDVPNGLVVTGTHTGFTPTYVNMGSHQTGITGRPNFNDVKRTVKIKKSFIQGLGTSTPADWHEIPITPKVNVAAGEQVWIVLPNYGYDLGGGDKNTMNLDYATGSGKYFQSTDGYNWFEVTGEVNYRMYTAKRVVVSVENLDIATQPHEREKILPIRADLEEKTVRTALLAASSTLGKEHRFYTDINISFPETRLDLAGYCKIQDLHTGLDISAKVVSYDFEAHGNDASKQGFNRLKLTLDEVHGV